MSAHKIVFIVDNKGKQRFYITGPDVEKELDSEFFFRINRKYGHMHHINA